jgi:Putative phage serine protease XkdF
VPWDITDVDSHTKGLTPAQKRRWVAIANSALAACLKDGKSQSECEASAIRQASGSVGKAALGTAMALDAVTMDLHAAIAKSDDERRRVFGWASIAVRKDGEVLIDLQDDVIDIYDLEEAWYAYVAESGELDFRHEGPVRGHLIEAMVFTPEKIAALGLPDDSMPLGAWVGYEIDNPADYALVKQLGFFMFSIAGTAMREEV